MITHFYHLMTLIRRHIKMCLRSRRAFCSIYLYIKKEISFQFKKGAMFVLWKNKKWFKIEFDLGEMIADNGYKFVYFYDMQGNYSLDFDYEEDFQK